MSNDSSTGGYLQPSPQLPTLPGSLTLEEFIQQVFVGVSGLPGDLVRPKWQPDPPDQPDINVNWLALGVVGSLPDANAAVQFVSDGHGGQVNVTQRMSKLEIQGSFYGPLGLEYAELVRDGFQIPQNLFALTNAGMGYVGESQALRVPDLVNERWVDRWVMSFFINRQILRAYPILPFVSVQGSVTAVLDSGTVKTVNWKGF